MALDAIEANPDDPQGIPPALSEMPTLSELQTLYFDGWRTLSIGRPWSVGMSRAFAQPLPAGDCLAVAESHGFDGPAFLRLCRELDAVYLASVNR